MRLIAFAILALVLRSGIAAAEAPAGLRVDAIGWLAGAVARRPVDGVPWSGGTTAEVETVDVAKAVLVAKIDQSRLTVPLERLEDRLLVAALDTAGAQGGDEGLDGTLFAAALTLQGGDATGAAALVDRATRVSGLAEQRFATLASAHGLPALPTRAERTAQAQAAREQRAQDEAERAAERKRKAAERINHCGRVLPPLPKLSEPILCGTPESDAVIASLQVFPKDNPWNEDVSAYPVLPESGRMIAALAAGKRTMRIDSNFPFIIVPPEQARIALAGKCIYGADPGLFPMPVNLPIEGWQIGSPEALDHIQRVGGGDRHAIIVDPVGQRLYEFYALRLTDAGWTADSEATFDLTSNQPRPDNWTSGDAAGLSMFAGVIRYDELMRGRIEHALRMTVEHTRKQFIYPASHWATTKDDPAFPAMGQRFRLKAAFDASTFSKPAQVIVQAMKTYGMLIADNGDDWNCCAAADPRFDQMMLRELRVITGNDLEAVLSTAIDGGPRTGAPPPAPTPAHGAGKGPGGKKSAGR